MLRMEYQRSMGHGLMIAMTSGIITARILETILLWRQMGPKEAFKTAGGDEHDFHALDGSSHECG